MSEIYDIDKIVALSDDEYKNVRTETAKNLQISVKDLDRRRRKAIKKKKMFLKMFRQVDPWPDTVDINELIAVITTILKKHVILPKYAAETIALWVLLTYVYDHFRILPILSISSATKRCGKTTLLILLKMLVNKPLSSSNATAAVIYRAIEEFGPTFLLDEADTFLNRNPDLRGIINSGQTKESAHVMRTEGENFDIKIFSTWCPKAIACIKKLPDTLVDRSIVIRLERKLKQDTIKRLSIDKNFDDIRAKCLRWAQDNAERLQKMELTYLTSIHDRAADSWSPLLAIAELAGQKKFAIECAEQLSKSGQSQDEEHLVLLLEDFYEIFLQVEKIPTREVLDILNSKEDRPWADYNQGKGIRPQRLAKMLKEVDIKPRPGTFQNCTDGTRGYFKSDFTKVLRSYLPDKSASLQVASTSVEKSDANELNIPDLHPCDLIGSCTEHDMHRLANRYQISSTAILEAMTSNQKTRFNQGHMGTDELEDIAFSSSERVAIQREYE